MKKITTLISAFALSIGVFAQAPVPTFYDFENGGIYPTGWTLNAAGVGTQYYTTTNACGSSAYSLKMDFAGTTTGENLVINVISQPGIVSYNIRGNTGSATPWSGTYEVQESITGAVGTYTTFKSHTGSGGLVNGPTACVTHTALPTNANSRYIRFYFLAKTTGNVCIDDINIATPSVPVGIRVKQGLSQIANGGFINPIGVAVASSTLLPLTIENYGITNTLSVSGATISGVNAADFVALTSTPLTINASSNTTYSINFTPSAPGTRTATLTYTTNDPSNLTFVVKLYGVGGTLATVPSGQATALTFPNVKTYVLDGQFTTSPAAIDALGGYLILRRNGGSVVNNPVPGVTYQRGEYIGTSQVVFSGQISTTTASFSPSYIRASNVYGFAIYTYNGGGSYINYNLTAPLSQTVATPFSMQSPTEYSTISVINPTFLTNLSALINPHTSLFYSNYTPTMIDKFETRDTLLVSPVLFTKVITCAYSGLNRPYNEPFDYTALDFSREHTYCHNWMPTNPADSPEKPEYNDQHHLYPTKQVNVNAVRSNYPLGDVVGTPASSYLGSKFGTDAFGHSVFEPRPNHKGNAARAIMYMATAYNGISGNNWKLRNPISGTIAYGQDQNVLKKWHFEDLPDSYDRARNDYVESIQGNRNPFVDSVRYACYIDFSDMTYIASPTYTTGIGSPCYVASIVGLNETTPINFEYILFPNPTASDFSLMIEANVTETFVLNITDIASRKVYTKNVDVTSGFNNIKINDVKLQSGIYFVNLSYKNEKITRKLIIE